ncbi:MAG: hemerythrin [Parcubacteria group bacterium LiPW_41]|nr:MAG: hemerythrin [Parcubacteria group bacterium LiPW_41]
MKIEWKPEYNMGIAVIDEQHKMFVATLNSLYEAILEGKGREHLAKIFTDLESYITLHFSTEEKYFHEFNYEGMEEHIKEHRKFQSKIAEFKNSFEHGESEISSILIDFLENWLIHHLATIDVKYIPCFKSHGL